MNKIIKRPESIEMHQLTDDGVEKFMEVIGLLRQHIDDQDKLYNIKPGNIDSRIYELLRELPKIIDLFLNELIEAGILEQIS